MDMGLDSRSPMGRAGHRGQGKMGMRLFLRPKSSRATNLTGGPEMDVQNFSGDFHVQPLFLVAPSHPVPWPFSFLVFHGSFHLTHQKLFFSVGSEGSPLLRWFPRKTFRALRRAAPLDSKLQKHILSMATGLVPFNHQEGECPPKQNRNSGMPVYTCGFSVGNDRVRVLMNPEFPLKVIPSFPSEHQQVKSTSISTVCIVNSLLQASSPVL